jgi:hypothetical protein
LDFASLQFAKPSPVQRYHGTKARRVKDNLFRPHSSFQFIQYLAQRFDLETFQRQARKEKRAAEAIPFLHGDVDPIGSSMDGVSNCDREIGWEPSPLAYLLSYGITGGLPTIAIQ